MGGAGRVVVHSPGHDPGRWWLAPARLIEPPIGGGVRSLHELAFAAAAGGRDVELRGAVSREIYDELVVATGASVSLPDEARPPSADDILVLPEVIEPLGFSRVLWSDARLVLLCLAPPGLLGWPLWERWEPADLLTVDPSDVVLTARRALRMAAALGLAVWTHMPYLARLAEEEGLDCTCIGNGTPGSPAPPVEKALDVAWLQANRWAPLAQQAAAQVAGSLDAIEEVPHAELLRRVSRARVLLWPSRIEGHGRIATEARLVGTVPVALSTNPFAVGLEGAAGAVAVPAVEHLGPAIASLLAEPDRLAALAQRGRSAASAQVDWDGYVARVAAALRAVEARPVGPGTAGRAALGRHVDAALADHRADAAGLRSGLAGLGSELACARSELAGVQASAVSLVAHATRVEQRAFDLEQEVARHGTEIARLHEEVAYRDRLIAAQEVRIGLVDSQRGAVADELDRFRRRPSVRLATWLADRLSGGR